VNQWFYLTHPRLCINLSYSYLKFAFFHFCDGGKALSLQARLSEQALRERAVAFIGKARLAVDCQPWSILLCAEGISLARKQATVALRYVDLPGFLQSEKGVQNVLPAGRSITLQIEPGQVHTTIAPKTVVVGRMAAGDTALELQLNFDSGDAEIEDLIDELSNAQQGGL